VENSGTENGDALEVCGLLIPDSTYAMVPPRDWYFGLCKKWVHMKVNHQWGTNARMLDLMAPKAEGIWFLTHPQFEP